MMTNNTIPVKYDEKTTWIASSGIGYYANGNHVYTGPLICIPSIDIDNLTKDEIVERLTVYQKYSYGAELLHYYENRTYYVDSAWEEQIDTVNDIYELSLKVKNSGIHAILNIDIDGFTLYVKEKLEKLENRIKAKHQKQKKKEIREQEQGTVYLLKSDYGYKIGKSSNLDGRLKNFGIKLPFEWECIFSRVHINYHTVEKNLHKHFRSKNINGEWFNLNEDDIEFIKQYNLM